MYAVTLVTPPTGTPVSLVDIKRHLGLSHSDDDQAIVDILLPAAVERVQLRTGRQMMSATRRLIIDCFPRCGPIRIPFPPLISVTSIEYRDADGVWQTVASDTYFVNSDVEPGEITLKQGNVWPAIGHHEAAAVRVNYTCGYASASAVPAEMRQATILAAAHLYDYRAEVITGTIVAEIPQTTEHLLTRWMVGDEFHSYEAYR